MLFFFCCFGLCEEVVSVYVVPGYWYPASSAVRPNLPMYMYSEERTFTSIQALSCSSNARHPSALCPDDAQHPSTDDMIPMQGFASAWFGRRTFNDGSGGSRGATLTLGPPLGLGGIVPSLQGWLKSLFPLVSTFRVRARWSDGRSGDLGYIDTIILRSRSEFDEIQHIISDTPGTEGTIPSCPLLGLELGPLELFTHRHRDLHDTKNRAYLYCDPPTVHYCMRCSSTQV